MRGEIFDASELMHMPPLTKSRDRAIVELQAMAFGHAIGAATFPFPHHGGFAMSKSKDQKKQTKKEPAKTPKEKKELKKVKKEERKRA